MTQIRALVGTQWRTMLAEFVPKIEALIEADRAAGRRARKRVRIGLYSFHTDMADDVEPPEKD
jgi:hypothetical protein